MNNRHDKTRGVVKLSGGTPASDGAGVKLTRFIGIPGLEQLDPFLLFDVFRSDKVTDYIAGFPPHPHRGFETVTYMFAGRMKHEDNAGHSGVIEAGGVQWMTAGRGIVHSEMPQQQSGLMWGCQLWVNLPSSEKMIPPRYQEFSAGRISSEQRAQCRLKVVAGHTSKGTQGAVCDVAVEPQYFDIRLEAGARFTEPVPESHNAFLFVVEGSVGMPGQNGNETAVSAGSLAILGNGNQVEITGGITASRLLLIAGRTLNEPVARAGPFVMNTREELMQAFADYQAGRF
jgi:redox-sensitive bicupin YhaK (pirin superfamily)